MLQPALGGVTESNIQAAAQAAQQGAEAAKMAKAGRDACRTSIKITRMGDGSGGSRRGKCLRPWETVNNRYLTFAWRRDPQPDGPSPLRPGLGWRSRHPANPHRNPLSAPRGSWLCCRARAGSLRFRFLTSGTVRRSAPLLCVRRIFISAWCSSYGVPVANRHAAIPADQGKRRKPAAASSPHSRCGSYRRLASALSAHRRDPRLRC